MRSTITKNGKYLKANEISKEEQEEVNLYARWRKSEERKILEKYKGEELEKVPEEYREKIAKLRGFGLGLKASKIQKAKQKRDNAKIKNDQTKELEQQVSEQQKKRGKSYDE